MAFRLKAPPIQVCLPSWLAGPIQVFMCHCWAFYRWFIQEVRLPTKVRISRDNNVQFAFWRLRKNPNAPRGYFWNSSNVQILRSPRSVVDQNSVTWRSRRHPHRRTRSAVVCKYFLQSQVRRTWLSSVIGKCFLFLGNISLESAYLLFMSSKIVHDLVWNWTQLTHFGDKQLRLCFFFLTDTWFDFRHRVIRRVIAARLAELTAKMAGVMTKVWAAFCFTGKSRGRDLLRQPSNPGVRNHRHQVDPRSRPGWGWVLVPNAGATTLA